MSELSWALKMMVHQKELQEFRFALNLIAPVMSNPEETREEKRATLNILVQELSDSAFKLKPIIEQIMTIINMKEDVCLEYPDSEAQTDGILGWLPRMKEHRELLLSEVTKHRKAYKLKV